MEKSKRANELVDVSLKKWKEHGGLFITLKELNLL